MGDLKRLGIADPGLFFIEILGIYASGSSKLSPVSIDLVALARPARLNLKVQSARRSVGQALCRRPYVTGNPAPSHGSALAMRLHPYRAISR